MSRKLGFVYGESAAQVADSRRWELPEGSELVSFQAVQDKDGNYDPHAWIGFVVYDTPDAPAKG